MDRERAGREGSSRRVLLNLLILSLTAVSQMAWIEAGREEREEKTKT